MRGRFCFLFLFALALPAVGNSALAQDAPEPFIGNVAAGRLSATASSTFQIVNNSVSGGTSVTSIILSTGLQYFLNDELSLGGVTTFFKQDSFRSFSLGPALTYFPWKEGRFAIPVGIAVPFEYVRSSAGTTFTNWELDFSVAIDYFANASVAIGPRFFYGHEFAGKNVRANDTFALLAQLSLFL